MRVLDLFCGQGGAGMGYHQAGFEVVGVDHRPQPRYPFEFHQADAMTYPLDGFDLIHASPPCQRFSRLTGLRNNSENHPDLLGPTRERLIQAQVDYVIENVPGSPMVYPVLLCGSMFGLEAGDRQLRRHRLFETNWGLTRPAWCFHVGTPLGVYGHGASGKGLHGHSVGADLARELMEMPWANRDGVSQAIPPAYTRYVGSSYLAYLEHGKNQKMVPRT